MMSDFLTVFVVNRGLSIIEKCRYCLVKQKSIQFFSFILIFHHVLCHFQRLSRFALIKTKKIPS